MPEWLIVLALMNKATLKWLWTSSGVNLCFHFSVGKYRDEITGKVWNLGI